LTENYDLDETDIAILKAGSLAIEWYLLPLWKIRARRKLARRINDLLDPVKDGIVNARLEK
jgi:hypothetical protein